MGLVQVNQSAESPFLQHGDKLTLANDMGSFFVKKISDLRVSLGAIPNSCSTISRHSSQCSSSFTAFHRVDMDYLRKLVLRTPTKSCLLDPVPTNIMKDCLKLDELLPILTTMTNLSLESGFFPVIWKDSVVTPLLKKQGLDFVFKNFRPISNLSFVSKLAERVAADQIQSYLNENDLFPTLQSAYRQHHSTETALLKVKNDILMSMEDKHVTLLVLLDLSAAFDTVDHRILLDRLQFDFGISGSALNWFESYLSNRTQRISIDGVLSNTFNLKFGVPQGSCLGPLLFSLYASKLFKIVESHLPNLHCYADDTQLYIAFRPGNDLEETAALTAMESCIADISQWMHKDKLKLNSDKTECLLIGTRQQLQKVSNISMLLVGDSQIAPSCEVRNLGTWFDSKMSMLSHINKTCSSAFYYLYNIRRIRKYLSRPTTESLVHAFITSRVDYCNSLLYGLPNSHIMKLQRIQNAAARLVIGAPRFCHVTPLLFNLHWLPISYRIKFKILLLTFKCLYGLAPNYLIDLICIKKQSRYSLRSNDSLLLELPSIKTRPTLGDRAFQSAAPYLWNALPSTIRNIKTLDTFKTAVKTHFFNLAFK